MRPYTILTMLAPTLALTCLTGCTQEVRMEDGGYVNAKVTDKNTGRPVAGAKLCLDQKPPACATSDASGSVTITPTTHIVHIGLWEDIGFLRVPYTVTAEGYETATGKTPVFEIKLSPK